LLNDPALSQKDERVREVSAQPRPGSLSDDYESGDAAWVTGHFKTLNAQIGSYETYDDELYG
jgi:hypothetical protein